MTTSPWREEKFPSFYHDLFAAVLQRREGFDDAKKPPRQIGVEYSMLYPAKLSMLFNGTRKTFLSPTEDLSFVFSVVSQD